jgi:hypothetical protein
MALAKWGALKERRSRLWKWNPAPLICRSFKASSTFVCPLGFRFASPRADILLTLRISIRLMFLLIPVFKVHKSKQTVLNLFCTSNGLGEESAVHP